MFELRAPARNVCIRTIGLATIVASVAGAAVPALADEDRSQNLQVADARSQYRQGIWGLWMHRREPSIAPTVAASSTRYPVPSPERVAVPSVPSIRRVSTTMETYGVSSARVPAPPTAEISRPAEVERVLASMGPDAAARLAAADSGMRLVLQVGSFLEVDNARALALRLSGRYSGVYTSQYDHHGRTFHRVRIARFSGAGALDSVEHTLRISGHEPLRILTPERPDSVSYRR